MKKSIKILLLGMLICLPVLKAGRHHHYHGDGGAAVAGTLGGLAVGTMIGSAASRGSDRAEAKADRALEEQQRDRMRMLERDLDRQTRGQDPWFTILIGLVFMMFVAVVGLGFLFLKKK